MSDKKAVLSVRIDPDLIERLRNVVYFKRDVTLNSYVEYALAVALNLENIPLEFEHLKRNLRTGKRVKLRVIMPEED